MNNKEFLSSARQISDIHPLKIVSWSKFAASVHTVRQRYRTKTTANALDRRLVDRTRLAPRRGLSREQAADYIGVSPSKFDQMRKDGRIGASKLIDGRKVWDIHQLDRDFDALPPEGDEDGDDWSASL